MGPGVTATQGEQGLALGLSTFAFTICFAVWTIFAIIGIEIKAELGLNDTQFGLLIGTPILTGSLVRLMLGIWTDQFGGRIVFPLTMLASAASTFLLSYADNYYLMLLAALGLGLAGGGFAVGVAYVSKFYPLEKQGSALGFFGMGNVGAAVTKFLAPWVMVAIGWQGVAQVWAAVLAVVAVLFFILAKDDPEYAARKAGGIPARTLKDQLEPLKNEQVWRFSLYYFFVFGAFVALACGCRNTWSACIGRCQNRRHAGRDLLALGQPVPRLWRDAVGQVWRAPYHVRDLWRVAGVPVHAVLPGDRLRDPRDRGRHRVFDLDGAGALRDHGVRARLLHVAGQGGGV
jgi:MFS family permease